MYLGFPKYLVQLEEIMEYKDPLKNFRNIIFIQTAISEHELSEEIASGLKIMITNHGKEFQHVAYDLKRKDLDPKLRSIFEDWISEQI